MYLELIGRLGRIRYHVLSVMGSGVVETGTVEGEILEAIMQKVHVGRFIDVGVVRVVGVPWLLSSFMMLL